MVAEDRYIAADAVELVEVDYEELPALVDPFKAMEPDAPVLREDLEGKTAGAHGARKHHNHIFTWEVGDQAATERAFADAEVTVKELVSYQRVHPCPLETCGCVASMDKIRGELTVYGTFQAPHVVRTVASILSGIPEAKIHVIAPDIGGGFGNKVGVYPGYVCAIVASIVLGVPVKWIEDRIENLSADRVCPRLPHDRRARGDQGRQDHRAALPRAGRSRRVRRLRRSDQVPGRVLPHLHRVLRHPGRACDRRRRLHQQGAGRGRLPLLVPGHRGVLSDRAHGRRAGAQAGAWTRPSCACKNFIKAEQFPYQSALGLGIRFRRLRDRACARRWRRSTTPACAASRRKNAARRRADGDRRQLLHRDRRRRADPQLRHPGRRHVRQLRDPRPSDRQRDRTARHQEPGPGPRDHLRPDPRDRDRHPVRA